MTHSNGKVVIVGGGYAGMNLARLLDEHADVTLVEPRSNFVHNVAAIRSIVEPELLEQALIPYDRLLKNGRVIQQKAATLAEGSVTLENDDVLLGDVIVVATGAGYAAPFKPKGSSIEEFRNDQKEAGEAIKNANSIAVVGAGPVGIELAAEIRNAYADKEISVITADRTLMPAFPPRFGKKLLQRLKKLNISVRLDSSVDHLESFQKFYGPATLSLSDGSTVSADVVFPVIGAKANTGVFSDGEGIAVDRQKRLKTDPWMRVPNHQKLFAFGDAADNGDHMTIVAISRQAPWLAKTIKQVLAGKPVEKLEPYTPWSRPLLLVPTGPEEGASILPTCKKGLVVGDWPTAKIKGRDLFLTKTQRELGYAQP